MRKGYMIAILYESHLFTFYIIFCSISNTNIIKNYIAQYVNYNMRVHLGRAMMKISICEFCLPVRKYGWYIIGVHGPRKKIRELKKDINKIKKSILLDASLSAAPLFSTSLAEISLWRLRIFSYFIIPNTTCHLCICCTCCFTN